MSPQGASVAAVRDRLRIVLDTPGPDARLDAELLLMHVLGRSRAWLIAHDRDPVAADARKHLEGLARRRRAGEPMAYLLGRREFWSLDLRVTPEVLIPRHETERLVECALARLETEHESRVADLGTGSGAVALALARECPRARIVASDESPGALAVAAENARRLAPGRVDLVRGHWLCAFAGAVFDLVVSNPPYVAAGDPHLDRGDLRFEPRRALTPGGDGLDAIRHIVPQAARCLRPGGWLVLEHGADQGEAVRAALAASGFHDIVTYRDLGGLDRVSEGCNRGAASATGGAATQG